MPQALTSGAGASRPRRGCDSKVLKRSAGGIATRRRAIASACDAFYFVTICAAERGTTMLSDNASVILDAVRHYQRIGKWFVTLFLIMPDHIHMLVHVAMARAAEDVGPYLGLSKTIGDFKAYLSKAHHIGFQRNFFDTRIRDAAHYAEKWKYICLNPVARGLVSTPREWPHSLAFDRETGAERPHR